MFSRKHKITNEADKPIVLAVESLHGDLALPFLQKLESDLTANAFTPISVLLPQSGSVEKLKPLLQKKSLGQNPKTGASLSSFERLFSLESKSFAGEVSPVLLLNNGNLASSAWYATQIEDVPQRIQFYRWIDEFEYHDLGLQRPDLTVYIDILPQHALLPDLPPKPVCWDSEILPVMEVLRDRYLEVSGLLPNVKVVRGYDNDLLLPDQIIYNQIWELVRRVVLKKPTK